MTATTLHLAVPEDALRVFRTLLHPLPMTTSDAGWDALELTQISEPTTPCAHVLIEAPAAGYDEIVADTAALLRRDPAGSWIAVETRTDDWSIQRFGGRIWHHVPTPRGDIVVIETHPWHD